MSKKSLVEAFDVKSKKHFNDESLVDYEIFSDMEMPVKVIDGNEYIGVLTFPAFDMEMPVMSDWSYPKLKISPCRYSGSAYKKDMVICAHNYDCHFGVLKSMIPGEIITFTDMDGNELIPFMRESGATPIIVLSARSNEKDKVNALDLGANDYITKPFGTEELLARVRATLRNSRQKMDADGVVRSSYSVNGLVIEYDRRRITVKGEEVKLTQTEYNIVELLASHSGRVLTYTEIINKIWRYTDHGSIKKLQVNMANIRKKLGEKPGENQYIANELGVGYRMVQEDD